jgi:ubiquinone/menaquinone biosynthesis C-methylase UbiE
VAAPTPDQRREYFAGLFDRLADTYDDVGVEYFTAFGRRLVELTGVRPGDHVLDAGCGRGAATFAAAEAVGENGRVTAIDISPEMVARTAADADARGLGQVRVLVGDAESPPTPEDTNTYDAVVSSLVIFFLPDPSAALRNYRALLPENDGRLGLTTFPPQPDTAWGRVGKAIERHLPGGGTATRPDTGPLSSPEALADALRATGFTHVTQTTEPYDARFESLDHWWRWAWSQGQRAALERVPPDELDAFRAELYDLLRPECDESGGLALRQYVTYTVGVT